MKWVPSDYKKSFLLIGLIFSLSCCAGLIYLLNKGFEPSESNEICRDEVVPKIPIYTNSTLITSDETESGPSFGSIKRIYRTADSLEDVGEFYNEYYPCPRLFLPREDNGSLLCTGRPRDRDSRVYYEVNISKKKNETIYSLHILWNCGFLDD